MNLKDLKPLKPEEIKRTLEKFDLLWLYQGEPRKKAPHVLLTGENHSDGFAMVGKLLKENPDIRMRFAEGIVASAWQKWIKESVEKGEDKKITKLVGADTSSTALAEDIAKILEADHIKMIKHEDATGKKQLWAPENKPLSDGDIILHIEELITTAFSALQVREGIRDANPNIVFFYSPYLPTVVERSNPDNRVTTVENSTILPLLQLEIYNYEPGKCRYCAADSEAIKAKDGNNWKKLHGRA